MALPAHLLEQLPPTVVQALSRGQFCSTAAPGPAERCLPLGISQLDDCLPDHGLLRGAVTELAVSGRAALATSVALAACRAAQQRGLRQTAELAWCAFIDPTATLYAPGVAQAGVALERLLVLRPTSDALGRVALRLAQSRAFSVVVIDTVGVPGASPIRCAAQPQPGQLHTPFQGIPLARWVPIVRRLALAVAGSESCVLLITDSGARRSVPLPTAMRIELSRPAETRLSLRIAKDQRGRVSRPRSVAWVRPGSGAALQYGPAAQSSQGVSAAGGVRN